MRDLSAWIDVLALALAVSTVSVALAKARFFRGLRALAAGWGDGWNDLFHCPYCLSHWIAFATVLVYRPTLIHGPVAVLDAAVSLFAIVALASVWSRLVCDALRAMDRLTDVSSSSPRKRRKECP